METLSSHKLSAVEALRRQEWKRAVAALESALQEDPGWVEGWLNLGLCWLRLKEASSAIRALEQGLQLDPARPRVRLSLADACVLAGNSVRAEAWCREECERFPDQISSWLALGLSQERRGEGEAEIAYRRAYSLAPNDPSTLWNLGRWLQENHRLEEAQAILHSGSLQHPSVGRLQWQWTVNCFLRGDWTTGLRQLDSRWLAPDFPRGPQWNSIPLWAQGEAPRSPIFVEPEQGFGDTLQFVRFVPPLVAQGHRVWLGVPKALEPLLTGGLPVEQILTDPQKALGAGCRIPIMSLPARLGIQGDALDGAPYLSIPCAIRSESRLSGAKRLRIGVVWRGNPEHRNDRRRSIPIGDLMPLFQLPDVEWVSLQLGALGVEDLAQLRGLGVSIRDGASGIRHFQDTAQEVLSTDLVVTVDTSIAHLAGALGHPVCTLLPYYPDWRWALRGDVTPWYRSMRLFRQTIQNSWESPVKRLCDFLRAYTETGRDPIFGETARGQGERREQIRVGL